MPRTSSENLLAVDPTARARQPGLASWRPQSPSGTLLGVSLRLIRCVV